MLILLGMGIASAGFANHDNSCISEYIYVTGKFWFSYLFGFYFDYVIFKMGVWKTNLWEKKMMDIKF